MPYFYTWRISIDDCSFKSH